MRSLFNSNVMTVCLMGVFLLLASAVGRVTASNVGGWLTGVQDRSTRASADVPGRTELAALPSWRVR